MSLVHFGSKAPQASASSQLCPWPASTEDKGHPPINSNASTQHGEILSNFKENKERFAGDDNIITISKGKEVKMGNQLCTSKYHSSKSDEKEEADIWVKRDDNKERAKQKRREIRKNQTRRGRGNPSHNTKIQMQEKQCTTKNKKQNNVIRTDPSASHTNDALEFKESDRWAGVKMADDYSSSSTGYHTPETRTPIIQRNESVKKQEASKPANTESVKAKLIPIETNQKRKQKISQTKNKEELEKGNCEPLKELLKDKPSFGGSKKQINDQDISSNQEEIKFKKEALAKLDSLTNSPRSQRRHGVLLTNEEANLISLPSDNKIRKPIHSSVVMRNAVGEMEKGSLFNKPEDISYESSSPEIHEEIKIKSELQCKAYVSPFTIKLANAPAQVDNSDKKDSDDCKKRIFSDTDVTNILQTPIYILEPANMVNDSVTIDSTSERASTIEIMEDNRANELREATAETVVQVPGPKLAVMACIPPPEKAVITNVPPPSPSSIDVIEEEEENLENSDYLLDRKSKEMETFSDNVCQRLSLLLESHELIQENVDNSPIDDSPAESNDMPEMLEKNSCSCCTDSESEFSDDEYDENDYIQESDNCDSYSDERESNGVDIAYMKGNDILNKSVARTPRGTNDATPLDMMNSNVSIKNSENKTLSLSDVNATKASKLLNCQVSASKQKEEFGKREETNEANYPNCVDDTDKEETIGKENALSVSKQPNDEISQSEILGLLPEANITSSCIASFSKEATLNNSKSLQTENLKARNGIGPPSTNPIVISSDTNHPPKRSRLDESLKALFQVSQIEESNESGVIPLPSLLDVDFDVTPTSDTHPELSEDTLSERHETCTQLSTGRRSLGCTESSDLDVSEQRDDVSTDSMLADDEDEGEVLFSRTYPEPSGGEVLVSCTVLNSALNRENSDHFWDDDILSDDDDDEPDDIPEQELFASDAYVDINDSDFDSARKQMQDIHEHLKNLKYQMNSLQDDLGAAACTPETPSDNSEPASKRRALTD